MRNHTMPEVGIRLHQIEERLDALDNKLLTLTNSSGQRGDEIMEYLQSIEFAREVWLRAMADICERAKPSRDCDCEITDEDWRQMIRDIEDQKKENGYAPQMARSGRLEKDHEVEGTM